MIIVIISWFLLSILIASLGQYRYIGYNKAFWVSLIFSPIIGFIVVFNSARIADEEYKDEVLQLQKKQLEQTRKSSKTKTEILEEELSRLDKLLKSDKISQEEYVILRANLFK